MESARLRRRSVLTFPAAGAAAAALARLAQPAVAGAPNILKPVPPALFTDFGTNAEMRWESVDPRRYLTPQGRLFVRNHTRTPVIDPADHALRVHGDGLADPAGATLTVADLRRRFRDVEVVSVHECTGNGRSYFSSQQGQTVSGTGWRLGAVGTVAWQGVRLRDVLEWAGIRPDAVCVQGVGLDPDYVDKGVNHGPVRRPFPVAKALDDALLAWGVNGEPLLPDHGAPLRLVLPGWIGIASIKWLGSLEVSRTELTSPWNTRWYNIDGPLTVNPVRSAWELPWDARVPAGRKVDLTGRSWSGAGPISRVEVSVDGGSTWSDARVHPAPAGGRPGHGWSQWTFPWRDPAPGAYVLQARATDAWGRTQPDVAAVNPNGYFFDAVVRHPVQVA
ncbi:molybdopterin-dependent oxidoreductase [Nocardioides stalactiti]|uniref:molybdopterin-dependent oxidoreductase n=1 Tax=Nocardioides stalactiti TaxID=2755356 RepID=UPI001600441A|nr:molybdopterin-dependent oxidoreductase [Nocardioides stalactiti]